MRLRYAIAIIFILIVAAEATVLFFANRPVEAQSHILAKDSSGLFRMYLDHPYLKDWPEQRVKDPF